MKKKISIMLVLIVLFSLVMSPLYVHALTFGGMQPDKEIEDKASEGKISPHDKEEIPVETSFEKGDLDRDGTVNADDAAYALDLYKYRSATEEDILIGDLNEDGTINADDAAMILDIYRNAL